MPTANPQHQPGDARQQLIDAMLVAARAMVALAARSLAGLDCDVTLPQYRALVVLAGRGPQHVVGIATELGVSPSTATRMCDRLVNKRLIHRSRTDTDRRQVQLTLTATGRTLVEHVTQRRRGELIAVVDTIPPAWHRPVTTTLRSVAATLGEPGDQSARPAPPPATGAAMSESYGKNSGAIRYRPPPRR